MNTLRNILARSIFPALIVGAIGASAVGCYALTPSGAKISTSTTVRYAASTGGTSTVSVAASNTVTITVMQVGGTQITPTVQIGAASPGCTGFVPVTIKNSGNGTDSFGLTVSGSSSWSPKFIADANGDGLHQSTETTIVTATPSMAAGAGYKCFLAVTAPSGTTGSSAFTLADASRFDPTKTAQGVYTLSTAVSGTPSLLEGGEPIAVSIALSTTSGVQSVKANGVPLTAGTGVWTGSVPASSVVGPHSVDIAATDVSGNVSHNTSVTYTTARVMASNGKCLNNPATNGLLGSCVFKIYGKASQVTANTFVVSDGSKYTIAVTAPGHSVHANDFVQARGFLSKTSGLILQSAATKVAMVR